MTIKESLMAIFSTPKYADNLRGVNLLDQLRAATAMELEQPSEELNSQVVDTINAQIISGKNCWDVADLLKKRLHSSKAHKQWLAVHLLGRVLRDCTVSLRDHVDDLLLEIARTMSRPVKPDTIEGRRTRVACIEVLSSWGEAGARAKLQVARLDGAWSERGGMEHVTHSCMSLQDPKMVKSSSQLTLSEIRCLNEATKKATDKDLMDPSEELNAQVVEIVNIDVKNGKDPQEIADILRQRLHSHKPRKQVLAIHLIAAVLRDCQKTMGAHQVELLEEVAKTMMRPAKPDTDEGKLTRDCAMDLLHTYGALGEAAIKAANLVDGAWGSGEQAHIDTHSCMAVPEQSNVSHLTGKEERQIKEQVHAACADELQEPNPELNAQVVETIKVDILHGKDGSDIVQVLKSELHSHKPHKQWLAIKLIGQVVHDCKEAMAPWEVELLEEVAKVMIRPSKPDSEEGKRTRESAIHLLRASGPAGNKAFVAANLLDGAWGSALALHIDTHSCMAVPERGVELTVQEDLIATVAVLVEQANANGELLRDLLTAQDKEKGAAGSSTERKTGDVEFEDQLAKDLIERATMLRDRLHSYETQLNLLSGPEVESLKAQAIKAEETLQACLARQGK